MMLQLFRGSVFQMSLSLLFNHVLVEPSLPMSGKIYKVNRCLARYSPRATTTNRPANRAPNKPAWPGPYQPKMPVLGQIWSFLGKKSFFLLEKSKVLLPTYWITHLCILFTLFFNQELDKMCKKWQYLAQNDQKCRFWTKFGHFWAKYPKF